MEKVILITRDECIFCDEAKAELQLSGISYEEKKIGIDITREEVLNKYPTFKYLPITIINEDLALSGFDALKEYINPELPLEE